MSDLWFNFRIGIYHFQIKYGAWIPVTVSRNDAWSIGNPFGDSWLKSPIALYDFKPIKNRELIKEGKS